ncbi:hypothetical protein [Spirosoma endbachense]|uniref:Uncharacterized protein n=1 Tax=Spirosoma endbachense TaxID=2666025 RepID=A0A6P1VR17_9BACT|nr:hypothetical protein [Spirosoma endbachense]QHV95701.1 hypothetical protein GJR95_12080 [Spirosoma endbachense]
MELQRILDADLMTHMLFLGGLVALISLVLLEAKDQTRQLACSLSSGEMIGLYYPLENGIDLFICKTGRDQARLIVNLSKKLVNRSTEVKQVLDIDAFQMVCGEPFNPFKLYTKLISSTACIYPMYHNTGIIGSNTDTRI